MHRILKPKLSVLWEEGYSGSTLLRDLMAGVVVAIMALPLSIAFAVASGARPEQGLITAIVAGFLGACFTGSRVQVTGPAGAFIVMVGSIITQHGYDGLLVATLMAGPILILLGFLRAGSNISFLARPVILGFTAGLSLVVFSTQIPHAVGLASSSFSSNLLAQWLTYGQGLHALNPYAVAIAALSLLITAVWPMGRTRIPGALIAVLCTAAIAAIWQLPIETLGSRFGQLTPSIPMPQFPDISWDLIVSLIGPAISIAFLGGIESLLSGVVSDQLTGQRHRPNMELISQGISNIGSALFGGLPATGTIARTTANVRAGAATPIAAMCHAVLLLVMLLFLTDSIAQIPMASLAGVLIYVAYRMAEWTHVAAQIRSSRSDMLCVLTTFLLTILVGLVTAIVVGTTLSIAQKQLAKIRNQAK